MHSIIQEYSIYSLYFAPRGKERLLFLGDQIANRHLRFGDRLIGVLGDAGSGKSSLIKGMFPGLELTNDDDRLDSRKIMQVRDMEEDFSNATTFHLDMRFQVAFTQMHEIVDFVCKAIARDRRVIVEHFNLLFPSLQIAADLMIGIGEEILVARPTVFGPMPQDVYDLMHTSLKYRKMAHTVEDITIQLLVSEFGVSHDLFYSSDIKNGFLLCFVEAVDLDFDKLAARIQDRLAENLPIRYHDETHIMIGDSVMHCTGPRLHLRNTEEVEDFRLIRKFIRDEKTDTYCLVGMLHHQSAGNGSSYNFHCSSAVLA
ncbi:MAG: alanine-tRNA synthetase second additional domain-containing protein [Deltaproteobacteria bacterium]|jgi:tRNA A37 threonylcarbamoyladenosine biosynthesis protein TsaE|nr:alanine-tRNA synthetase second additional domain-containing protein [Deltaproteobacteria bacterium]